MASVVTGPRPRPSPHSSSTLDDLEPGRRSLVDRVIHGLFVAFVVAVLVAGLLHLLGPREAVVSAANDRLDVALRYDRLNRPGLAATWALEVTSADGEPLPAEVEVRTSSSYLDAFDQNGLDPRPVDETADADEAIWTFRTAPGATSLTVTYDARVQPGWRAPIEATTSVTAGGDPPLRLRYRTWLVP